jgi:hypothetical protein
VSAFLHALLGVIVLIFVVLVAWSMSVARDMAREEIRDRMEHISHAILHLAACRLDREQRVTIYEDEWLPELTYILNGDEARPVTRLFKGSWFAIGIFFTARRIADRLDRPAPEQARDLPQDADLAAPGTAPAELGRHHGRVGAVAVLADGRVASSGDDGRVLVWDPAAPGPPRPS